MRYYMSATPDDEKVKKFADYFCETYIDSNRYLPELGVRHDYRTQNNNCRRTF